MKRRENEVSRLGRFERDLRSLQVTHLTDEDNFWRLSQGSTQRRRKIFRIGSDLSLIDRRLLMIVKKLDRVFDRHNVIRLRLVDAIDDRSERRALTRTRGAGEQD